MFIEKKKKFFFKYIYSSLEFLKLSLALCMLKSNTLKIHIFKKHKIIIKSSIKEGVAYQITVISSQNHVKQLLITS